MATSLPLVPTPRPKFEFFIAAATLAVTIYTAIKVVRLQQSIDSLERNLISDRNQGFETDVNTKL